MSIGNMDIAQESGKLCSAGAYMQHAVWPRARMFSTVVKSPNHSSRKRMPHGRVVACPPIWFRAMLSFGSQFSRKPVFRPHGLLLHGPLVGQMKQTHL